MDDWLSAYFLAFLTVPITLIGLAVASAVSRLSYRISKPFLRHISAALCILSFSLPPIAFIAQLVYEEWGNQGSNERKYQLLLMRKRFYGNNKVEFEEKLNWTITPYELEVNRTPFEYLRWSAVCMETGQFAAARSLAIRALTSRLDEQVAEARAILDYRLPAVDISPEVREHYNQAIIEIVYNNLSLARTHLFICMKLNKNFEWPYTQYAVLERKAGNLSRAHQLATRAVTINPRSARGWCELSEILARLGRKDESMRAAKRAYKLDPRDGFVADSFKRLGS